jgi:hypothetical protein
MDVKGFWSAPTAPDSEVGDAQTLSPYLVADHAA